MKEWLSDNFEGLFIVIVFAVVLTLYYVHNHSDSDTSSSAYSSCSAAHADGVYDIGEDDPRYVPSQDADRDGVACEHYLGN